MKLNLPIIVASLTSLPSLISGSNVSCGLVINNTKSAEESTTSMDRKYSVSINVPKSSVAACKESSTYTIQMQNGHSKSFKKMTAASSYWYGEDKNGSSFNYIFNGDGEFVTGSMTDISTGDIIQFRKIGEDASLFAFVTNSNEYGED